MARKKKDGAPESSYTLREEQETMLGLPTKAPETLGLLDYVKRFGPNLRLSRIIDTYKPRPRAPEGQMGFGLSFGVVEEGNQLGLFDASPCACKKKGTSGEGDNPAPSTRRRKGGR